MFHRQRVQGGPNSVPNLLQAVVIPARVTQQ